MRTARTLEADWGQVLLGSVSTRAKEDESSTGRVWAAGFHHVTAGSRLAVVLKLMNRLFIEFSIFFGPRYTADIESVGTGARLHYEILIFTLLDNTEEETLVSGQ
jgi:hypothetical protein